MRLASYRQHVRKSVPNARDLPRLLNPYIVLGHVTKSADKTCAQVVGDLHDLQQFTKATVGEV